MSDASLPQSQSDLFNGTWEQRLEQVRQMMLEMSQQTDPQAMVERYGTRVRQSLPNDGIIAVSRRGLAAPLFKITRSHLWGFDFDPWKNARQLTPISGGVLGSLLYNGAPKLLPDFHVERDDPAAEHLKDVRSIFAMPAYDGGVALNMTFVIHKRPDAFKPEMLPNQYWVTSLFGRVTHNLVLARQLKAAYEAVDKELQVVGDIQRSLLPDKLPPIAGLKLSAHYLTSRRAGGDYYDFFPLSDGRWGIFIADVSGHGTPAAVLMAVTHSIAHGVPGEPDPPSRLLRHANEQLARLYTNGNGTFVTAFYGIFDPATKMLTYCCAGHPQPRVQSSDERQPRILLDQALSLPLGIVDDEDYTDATVQLKSGDVLVLFTDGITESRNAAGELFGEARLDEAVGCCRDDTEIIIRNILLAVEDFTDLSAPIDDQTLIVARVE